MGKKAQVGIIISIVVLLLIIALAGWVFYNAWNSDEEVISNESDNATNTRPTGGKIGVTGVVSKVNNDGTLIINDKIISLLCVKLPKQGSYYYNEATQYLSDLVLNKEVTVEDDFENLGAIDTTVLFRYIWVDGKLVNQNLVKNGYAKSDELVAKSPKCQAIIQSESIARVSNVGLWRVEGGD